MSKNTHIAEVSSDASGTCSFCGNTDTPVICSKQSEKAICWRCAYHAKVAVSDTDLGKGDLPFQAVYCFKCQGFHSFIVETATGAAKWMYAGLDAVPAAIYQVVSSSGMYRKSDETIGVTCGLCNASMPLWMPGQNKYAK